mgnify:CR=1 FL=1
MNGESITTPRCSFLAGSKNEPKKSRLGRLGLTLALAPLKSIKLGRCASSNTIDFDRFAFATVQAPDSSRPTSFNPHDNSHGLRISANDKKDRLSLHQGGRDSTFERTFLPPRITVRGRHRRENPGSPSGAGKREGFGAAITNRLPSTHGC